MWPMAKYDSSDSSTDTVKHARMLLVRGIPGSGKSYITTQLMDALKDDTVIILDPDTVDTNSDAYKRHVEEQTAQGVDEGLHLYRYLRTQAYAGIASGSIIIWNQPFTNLEIFNKMVANFRLQATEHDVKLSVLVVEVEIDTEMARKRVQDRKQAGGHGPSQTTFDRFVADYKTFGNDGYQVVAVRGDDVKAAVDAVIQALHSL